MGGSAQLEVALGPPLEQEEHDVKEQHARVGADAAERKTASKLAVCAHGTHADGADSCAHDAELDVAW